MDELTYAAVLMLEHVLKNPELEPFRLSRPQLMTFMLATRRQYGHEKNVFYHNWRHAVDVTQSLYCFLCDVHLCPPLGGRPISKKEMNALERLFTPLDALILLVSAIGHDVGHPGVNNAFLVASNHHLAQMYNDRSVLENYHGAAYSQLLRRHWSSLSQVPHFRTTMISTILATDMQRHFEYMGQLSDLKRKVSEADEELSNWNDKDKDHAKEVAMALLIKAADISNVARPFDISAHWALVLMNEFANQGQLESELQIPTCLFGGPPNTEDRVAAAQSQKGFMDVFGFPLFRGLCDVMPNVSCTLPELEKNRAIWEQRISEETALRDAARSDAHSPQSASVEVDNAAARTRTRASEPSVTPLDSSRSSTPVIVAPSELGGAGSPTRITANPQRLQLSTGGVANEPKRPAAAFLSAANDVPTSPIESSRRSSKDVALTQLHDYSVFAQLNMRQNFQSGDRRGSADASWSIHQSYPPSRRGSKDESLTTILVTSQPNPISRSVPGSPVKTSKPSSSSKIGGVGLRSAQVKQSSSTHRSSVPSIRSQVVSSVATPTDQPSPLTIPSSIGGGIKDESVPPHVVLSSSNDPVEGMPSAIPGTWPLSLDGTHQRSSSSPTISSSIPSTPLVSGSTNQPTSPTSRPASGDLPDESPDPTTSSKSDSSTILRESRSRSRLRGLKFWKRRREVSGMESLPSSISSNNRSSPSLARQTDLPPQTRASHPSLPDLPS
jgi:hypothetical protein